MDPGLLDMLHDATNEQLVSIEDAIDVDFDC